MTEVPYRSAALPCGSAGSSTCISPAILAAANFLTSIGYIGPGTYVLSAAQASQAPSYEVTLDNPHERFHLGCLLS